MQQPLVLEGGRLGQDPVDLHRPAARAVAAHVLADLVREVLGADEVEHRRLRMRAGEHDRGRDRLAAVQRHAAHAAVAHVDRGHGRAGADDRAVRARAAGQRVRDRSHPAAHVAPRAADAVELPQLVVQQVVGRARRARAGPHADDAGGRVRALERVVLEPVVEQVADRHRHHAVELVQAAAREPGGPARLAHQLEHVARALGADRGRRAQHHRPQHVGDALHHRLEVVHRVGVMSRHRGDRRVRGGRVVVEEHRAAVGRERRERRVERDRVVAEALELEVFDDLRAQHRDHVGGAADALAGPYLLGHARAAEQVAPLQHAHAQARAREIRGRCEAVVAAADDDRVEVRIHRSASR